MIATLDRYEPGALSGFDQIIDVRSPAEFALDHLPGAVSLPVLSDAERTHVGTIYVQESRLKARRIGAAIVARSIAAHLDGPLADKPGAFSPLIYCWRGGQRSNALATVLLQVGWRVTVLRGGYKTYRRWITSALYEAEPAFKVVLLDGDTGTAKTDVLARLAGLGVQTLDLEDLAGHRGSLFGARPGRPQPSQKMFESRLAAALCALDPARSVVVEAESSKIGDLMTPPTLWKAMSDAPRIELAAPAAERARYLVAAYAEVADDPAALQANLARLPPHLGSKRVAEWREMAQVGDFEALALGLIEAHYDPAYARSRLRCPRSCLGIVSMATLAEAERQQAAEEIARLLPA